MRAFEVPAVLNRLTGTYPTPELVLDVVKEGDRSARDALSRLWLSEGIPFAFKGQPGLYESIRDWLAYMLNIEAKQLTLIGSGRHGFSLKKDNDKFGRQFGPQSDLDFTAISHGLFQRLHDDFWKWEKEFARGVVKPQGPKQSYYWGQNKIACPNQLRRGFIDLKMIPTLSQYADSQKAANALWLGNARLKLTPGAPKVTEWSLRVYQDWNSFIQQMAINLKHVGDSI